MLCSLCVETFVRKEEVVPDQITALIPFHTQPWQLLAGRDVNSDIEAVSKCQFCTFIASSIASERALVGNKHNKIISTVSLKGKSQPHFSSIKSYGSDYQGHHSYRIAVLREKLIDNEGSSLLLFSIKDPRIQSINPISPQSKSTSSESSFKTLENWITTCNKGHGSCNRLRSRSSEGSKWLPTRLIDIGQEKPGLINLIRGADVEREADCRYAALSYCWGPSASLKILRSSEIESFEAGIDANTLPATFQDAISAATRLGLRYLWIDALCIIQDSLEDWKQEASTMSKVYSCAFVTLAAAASEDSGGGLYRDRSPSAVNGVKLNIKWPTYVEGEFYCVPEDPWIKAVHNSPLLERAWVFQERLLSSRVVYFAFDQLYWECGELYASEIYPSGGPWDLEFREKDYDLSPRLPLGVQPARDGRFKNAYTAVLLRTPVADDLSLIEEFCCIWATIVTEYSKGRLTYKKDKLIAISGVANQMEKLVSGNEYLAGLWRSSLPLLLLWYCNDNDIPSASYQGPTWSWASLSISVTLDFMFRALDQPEIAIDVLNASTIRSPDSMVTGPVTDGILSLKGQLCEITATKSFLINLSGPFSSYFYTRGFGKYEKYSWRPFHRQSTLVFRKRGVETIYPSKFAFNRDPYKYSRIFGLKVASSDIKHPWGALPMISGLLLSPTEVRGQFIRIGYFEIAPKNMGRSWKPSELLWSLIHGGSKKDLFEGSQIDSRFYTNLDDDGKYTITIV